MQRSKTSANTPIDVIRILTFCKLSQTIRENEEGKDRRVIGVRGRRGNGFFSRGAKGRSSVWMFIEESELKHSVSDKIDVMTNVLTTRKINALYKQNCMSN